MSTSPRLMALARLSSDGSAYRAFTYAGHTTPYTSLSAIGVDRAGFAYMAGLDADSYYLWVDQVDATGVTLTESTIYSTAIAAVNALAVDASGGAYLTGDVVDTSFPSTPGAPQPSLAGGRDAFVAKISFSDSTTDLARGQPAVASSIEAPQYAAANAVDGDPTTRWSSQFSDPQWIYVDLSQRTQIDHVILRWETAYGNEIGIQVSDDAQSWTEAVHWFSRGGTDAIGVHAAGRYVRMYGYARGTQWGYSLWSFEVYGTPFTSEPPPPPGGSLPSPWVDTEVGSVGVAGSATYASGTFTVSGAGADIWGAADGFNFVSQSVGGQPEIVARVVSLQNTSAFAKAGVMLRETTAADSAHVILDVRPDGSIEFMERPSTGAATSFIAGGSLPFPVWLRLFKANSQVVAQVSSDGVNWSTIGGTQISMSSNLQVGLVVTSHDTSQLATAGFDNVSLGSATNGTLPTPWSSNDVGSTGTAGSASYQNGAFTVGGAGSDIWGSSDSFQFTNESMTGDGAIVARVQSESGMQAFAKAGVMLRETLDAGSADVILDVRPGGSIEFMSRSTTGGSTAFVAGATQAFPAWLKLARAGNTITASVSADGTGWSTIGATTVALAGTIRVGLAVTSHDPSTLNTARFDNVSVTAASAPPPSNGNVVLYASDFLASSIHGSWTTASDPTAANGVKLVTSDNGVSNTSASLASPTDFVEVAFNAAANVPYTIWLRMQALGNSKLNDSMWIQFSNAAANGSSVYPIGTTSALLVNLATDSSGSSLNGWGWQNTAYWLSQATTVTFPGGGVQTIRIQVREDGVEFDQIVLSPSQYVNAPPGSVSNDATIVPRP
jgi:regulation of enolase protein 1 (concanavalin A-like superfamily)